MLSLIELSIEEKDDSSEKEIGVSLDKLNDQINSLNILLKLAGEHDKANAIMTINAGAGGTDAQDWAEMLMRMYLRFCEQHGFATEIVEISAGDEAGIKSATIIVNGLYAYGYLKAERGVHRLVRLSPFNANNKRQTSFASIEAIPEINDDQVVEINPDDLRVDTYRASGAGGQHINKTDSAVRITHLPTGEVAQCQSGRSQIQNRETAMRILYAKLQKLLEEQKKQEISELKGEQKQISWGNQIRSYVFHPYSMVKDHRLGVETSNVQKVMDGDIMPFIESYLNNKEFNR
jgi:peptide chain release factor 2